MSGSGGRPAPIWFSTAKVVANAKLPALKRYIVPNILSQIGAAGRQRNAKRKTEEFRF